MVYIADSDGVRDIFDVGLGPPVLSPSVPLAVLVDKGTASAAEVLAGALRDNGRVRLLGERTFGAPPPLHSACAYARTQFSC